MRVFVTGASGHIGSALVPELLQANHHVIGLARSEASAAAIAATGADVQRGNLDDQLAEMTAMRDEGLIRGIGLSNATLDELQRALPADIACVQNAYNLLDRSAEPVLDLCSEHDIPWVPFFPLGSAFPNIPKVTEHPTVIETAHRLEATPAQVGLAWLLAHDANTFLIPGTANPHHLRENIASQDLRLDATAEATLNTLASQPAPAPYSARYQQ